MTQIDSWAVLNTAKNEITSVCLWEDECERLVAIHKGYEDLQGKPSKKFGAVKDMKIVPVTITVKE